MRPSHNIRALVLAFSSRGSAWAVYELAPGRGYVGALAVEGDDPRLVFWNLAARRSHAP